MGMAAEETAANSNIPSRHPRVFRVGFIGNPNTGKSTLFSALSGLMVRTGNYPGVTVEKRSSQVIWQNQPIEFIDLPGTYSLAPRSPDEMVAVEVLTGSNHNPPVDLVICVASALILERNLFLLSQLLELEVPVILAVNMIDVARSRGQTIDADLLSKQLGIPVILTAAARREGIEPLRKAILQVATHPTHLQFSSALPDAFQAAVSELADRWQFHHRGDRYLIERSLLDLHGAAEKKLIQVKGSEVEQVLRETRQRLEADCGNLADLESGARYAWIRQATDGVVAGGTTRSTWTDRIDSVLTGRWTGMIAFVFLMLLVFQIIFTGSAPLMWVCEEFQNGLVEFATALIPPGMFRSLMVDGVIAGVGGVLIFVPQVALLFLVIAILEDCGYIARAAFLSDRLMSLLGLSGKSFLPLISSFGCAVPGIMATRVIENSRDRLVTILIAPLMSCSARLPVYMLMISAFIPETRVLGGWLNLQGLVLMGMYLVGAFVAIPTAWFLRKTFFRGDTAPFVLELPEYKIPSSRVVLLRVWEAVREFILRAGTLIFAATILIWAAGYFPGDHRRAHEMETQLESPDLQGESEEIVAQRESLEKALNAEQASLLENSLLGRAGHAIEPLVRPLGWDWKIGVGALASFPAREVIISTLGTIYSLGGDVEDESGEQSLRAELQAAQWPDGRPVYGVAVALSVMVFFALCAQCMSTLVVMKRETNSWRWPVFSFFYMTTLAYFGAMLVYQVASRFGG